MASTVEVSDFTLPKKELKFKMWRRRAPGMSSEFFSPLKTKQQIHEDNWPYLKSGFQVNILLLYDHPM